MRSKENSDRSTVKVVELGLKAFRDSEQRKQKGQLIRSVFTELGLVFRTYEISIAVYNLM